MPAVVDSALVESIRSRVAEQHDTILNFFREIVAIPSVMGQIGDVGQRVLAAIVQVQLVYIDLGHRFSLPVWRGLWAIGRRRAAT